MANSDAPAKPASRRIPLWALLIVALLFGMALFGEKGVLRALQASRQKDQLQAQVEQLEAANAALRKEIDALRNDRQTIENLARKELGMVKDGELVYQFRNHPPPAPQPPPANPAK